MDSLVAKIRKSASAELWIALRVFNNKQYVDVREHFLSGDDREWRPTKKGIMIEPETLPQVIDGIEQLDGVTLGVLVTIPKTAGTEIRIGVQEYQKHNYGDVRTYYHKSGSSEMKPTHKGFTFKNAMKDALLEALRNAEDALEGDSED